MIVVIPIKDETVETKLVAIGAHFQAERDEDGFISRIKMIGDTEFTRGTPAFDCLRTAFEKVTV